MEHFRGAAFRFVTIIGRYEAQNKQPNFLSAPPPHLNQLHLIIASSFDCHQQLLYILWHTLRRLAGTNLATANNKYYRHAKLTQNVGKYLLHSRTRVLVNICIRLLLLFTLVFPFFFRFFRFCCCLHYWRHCNYR